MTGTARTPLYKFWAPKYWPTWLGIGFLRICCFLPYKSQIRFGEFIGRVAHRVSASRRAITRRNIELCFPELTVAERDTLALEHFEALGASLMEFALSRWASDELLDSMTTVHGAEHINDAVKDGHGVIMLSAHFTTLEITARPLGRYLPPVDLVYRKFRSGLMTEFVVRTREIALRRTIEKNDIKTMVRTLRDGGIVWYAPDQSYSLKQSAQIPFFGVPAMTNTATSSLAKLGRAKVVPFFPRRLAEGGYELTILPPFENFPGDDPVADTQQYIDVLEEHIRLCPEQYYWIHRKFKNRGADLTDAYANLDALK
jgi:KDO2-lipid IV(A) lauroyltransferase